MLHQREKPTFSLTLLGQKAEDLVLVTQEIFLPLW